MPMSLTPGELFGPFCNNLERPRALRMKRREIVHIRHVLRSYIERSQVIEPAEQGAQRDVKLAKGEILADTRSGTARERDKTLLACAHDYSVRIHPSRGIKYVWRWEGILVAVHHPGTHRDGGLLEWSVS
jgi:hypothetical protein